MSNEGLVSCFPNKADLHLRCTGFTTAPGLFSELELLRLGQADTLPKHSGCLEAWKSSPPPDVVFLRLAFSCFPGGQVAKLFQDSSLGNAVNIVVTRLILLMEDQVKTAKLSCFLLFKSAVIEFQDLCQICGSAALFCSPDPCGSSLWNQALAAARSMTGCKKAAERANGRCVKRRSKQVKLLFSAHKNGKDSGDLILVSVQRTGERLGPHHSARQSASTAKGHELWRWGVGG